MHSVSNLEKATYLGRHILKFRYGNKFLIGKLYANKVLYEMIRKDTTTEEDLKAPFFFILTDDTRVHLIKCEEVTAPDREERFLFFMNGSWCLDIGEGNEEFS